MVGTKDFIGSEKNKEWVGFLSIVILLNPHATNIENENPARRQRDIYKTAGKPNLTRPPFLYFIWLSERLLSQLAG